jgi:hypothetical protein
MIPLLSEGQLVPAEREVLTNAVLESTRKPQVILEIGTWLGGGSTITFLQSLQRKGSGHLWGVEANPDIYERMIANLKQAVPEALDYFTPLFGFSQKVLPVWVAQQPQPLQIDIAFLDGGNNPLEQITEFNILDPYLPVGARLFGHDAKMRKGRWLVPFLSRLDNWEVQVLDISTEGLLSARKLASQPSPESLRAAQAHLHQLRWTPIEVVASLIPSKVIRFLLHLIPRKIGRRLTDGRE